MANLLNTHIIACTEAHMTEQLQAMAAQEKINLRQISWLNDNSDDPDDYLLIMQLDDGIIEAHFSAEMLLNATQDPDFLNQYLEELIKTLKDNR